MSFVVKKSLCALALCGENKISLENFPSNYYLWLFTEKYDHVDKKSFQETVEEPGEGA